ncbi:glycine betaine ABC transporter substrate-binding protein [Halotalea alkalilenta]|uniref:glycine betaine ABC transporter substrate-binding protein n=1 Tax=Halotalea alkalilenta TaxID=376489 RepID=UPI0004889A3A|nr:glycine betaine ABC transporter substrate-binding protein [Halotalea alkalilenta]
MKLHLTLPLVASLALSTAAFAADKPSLSIGYVNGWDDSVATTHVAAAILEEKLGYPVELRAVEPAIMWQGVARGDLDLTLSAWLPATHGEYYERLKDDVEILGTNYEDAKIGLVVPDYVQARSIEDLEAERAAFDGRITGIDAGAGVMRRTEDAIREYGLDYTLMPSSGPAMTVALGRAINAEQPIVVTSWIPHWMFAKWQLRFLDDPKSVFGEAERIDTVAHPGIDEKAPEASAFLKRFSWGPDDVGAVMLAISEGATPDQAAKDWVANHEDRVAEWLD